MIHSNSPPRPSNAAPPLGLTIPEPLRSSPLVAQGGLVVLDDFPGTEITSQLLDEARRNHAEATDQESWEPNAEEGRGGTPPRKLLSTGGGPVQDAFYAADWLRQTLAAHVGLPVRPSGNRGSYSYYCRSGDFLDLHRDILTCDLTVITALHDAGRPEDPSGALVVYPGRLEEPLSAIHAAPYEGAYVLSLQPGQSVAILGGILPHRVLPVTEDQTRIVSVLCFEVEC